MKKRLYNKLWTALAFAVWGSIFLTSCGTSSGNTLSETEIPLYFHSVDNEESIKLCFADESKDIPYLDIDTAVSLVERVNHEIIEDKNYQEKVRQSKSLWTKEKQETIIMSIVSFLESI